LSTIIFILKVKKPVGKTTMAANLAAQLEQKNKFILIDADIQASDIF
jgi:MinD-like ATPase involved in chromosome partitioning or flagellar assembly